VLWGVMGKMRDVFIQVNKGFFIGVNRGCYGANGDVYNRPVLHSIL